jgi:phage gp29-like protein
LPIFNQKSNRWREFYNPLRGLNIAVLNALLDAGERGQFADLQWFYYYMERSDPMIFSILQRRRAALLDSDWDIRVPAQVDDIRAQSAVRQQPSAQSVDAGLADEQAAFLREVYDGIANFRDALGFLFMGFFRGYAHLEKHFGASGEIVRLEPVEQWFWVRDGMFGEWEYNENAVSGRRRGVPIERGNFVIFEAAALNRMLAVLYLRKVRSQTGWDSLLDVFGVPSVFLIGPPNAVASKEEEYQKIAEDIISDGRGYLPNGSDIKYVTGGVTKPPFLEHMQYVDRQITMIGTGGLLTMLTESGSGTLAGSAHQDTFQQIARGDAATLSEVFQREIDQPMLAAAFPGQPPLAYFEFAPCLSDQASRVVQDAAALAAAGMPVDPAQVGEKTGYQLLPAAGNVGGAVL